MGRTALIFCGDITPHSAPSPSPPPGTPRVPYLVDAVTSDETIKDRVERVEHSNDVHGTNGRRHIGEGHDVTEQKRGRLKFL